MPRVCPVYFRRDLGFWSLRACTVIQLLGLGIGLGLAGIPPLYWIIWCNITGCSCMKLKAILLATIGVGAGGWRCQDDWARTQRRGYGRTGGNLHGLAQPGNAAGKRERGREQQPGTRRAPASPRLDPKSQQRLRKSSMDPPWAVWGRQQRFSGLGSEPAVRLLADRSLPSNSRHPPTRPW